jgi:hypothetical protein
VEVLLEKKRQVLRAKLPHPADDSPRRTREAPGPRVLLSGLSRAGSIYQYLNVSEVHVI